MMMHLIRRRAISSLRCGSRLQERSFMSANNGMPFSLDPPELDYNYLGDPNNADNIVRNIKMRKHTADIKTVHDLMKRIRDLEEMKESGESSPQINEQLRSLRSTLVNEARKIPNKSHPNVEDREEPVAIITVGKKPDFQFKPQWFEDIAERLRLLQMDDIAKTAGKGSYYLKGELAEMEDALVEYTTDRLLAKGFHLMSVPDLLHPAVFDACGMDVDGPRTQIYRVKTNWKSDVCLAGTSEVSLAAYFTGKDISEQDLPYRLACISRCYRAEVPKSIKDKGLYRVPQFTKVEMFGVTANRTGEESTDLLKEFLSLQESLFSELGLHFQVLDMPPCELGPSAYRKFDIEAWMPGREMFGEISSTSNCTDFQSRRLHIKYQPTSPDGPTGLNKKFAHTVNGTACAVPRMLIAIFETFQRKDGSVTIPKALVPYMPGEKDVIQRNDRAPKIYWIEKKFLHAISNIKKL